MSYFLLYFSFTLGGGGGGGGGGNADHGGYGWVVGFEYCLLTLLLLLVFETELVDIVSAKKDPKRQEL